MLTEDVIDRVASKIVQKTKSVKNPKESWKIIVKEIFEAIKQDAVVNVNELNSIQVNSALLVSAPPTAPIPGLTQGQITTPSTIDLKGKIT